MFDEWWLKRVLGEEAPSKITNPVLITKDQKLTDSFDIVKHVVEYSPEDNYQKIKEIHNLVMEVLGSGRFLALGKCLNDHDTCVEVVPFPINYLPYLPKLISSSISNYLLDKHPMPADALIEDMRKGLSQLDARLKGVQLHLHPGTREGLLVRRYRCLCVLESRSQPPSTVEPSWSFVVHCMGGGRAERGVQGDGAVAG